MSFVTVGELSAHRSAFVREVLPRLIPESQAWLATGLSVDDVLALYPMYVSTWQALLITQLYDGDRDSQEVDELTERVGSHWENISFPNLTHLMVRDRLAFEAVKNDVILAALRGETAWTLQDPLGTVLRPFRTAVDLLACWLAGAEVGRNENEQQLLVDLADMWVTTIQVRS